MTTLYDGTVLPSFMKVVEGAGPSGYDLSMNDFRLRVGRIVAIHAPTAASNNNGKIFEYDVEVDVGAGVKKVYPRCVMADLFGGVADFLEWTPRLSSGLDESGTRTDFGTRVLLLCLNGHSSRPIIIGGVKHHGRQVEAKEGHHLTFEFNGVRINIDKDGAFVLTRYGRTDADGTPSDEYDKYVYASKIAVERDGSIKLATGDEEYNNLFLDTFTGDVSVEAERDIIAKTDGGFIKLQSSDGVRIGAVDSLPGAMILGETYVNFENTTIFNLLTSLYGLNAKVLATAAALSTAGASMGAAAQSHLIPVAGPIIGSPALTAASTSVLAGAAQLNVMSADIAQIITDLTVFYQNMDAFLSKKNKND